MNATNFSLVVATSRLSVEEVTLWYYIMLMLSLMGSLSLVLLLVVQFQLGKLRMGSGLLIAHALLVELCICAVHTPLQTVAFYHSYHNWPYGFSCRSEQIASIIFYHAENWGALFLALNRVVGIIFPHYYTKWSSKRALVASISLSWLIPVGLNMLTILGAGVQVLELPPGSNNCLLRTSGPLSLLWSAMTVYIPLGGTCSIYALILLKIKCRPNAAQVQAERLHAKRMKMLKVLFVASVWYAVSMLVIPISLVVWKGITPRSLMWMRVYQLLGSAASPAIFFALNVEYRTKLKDLLRLTGTRRRIFMGWLQEPHLGLGAGTYLTRLTRAARRHSSKVATRSSNIDG